MIKIECKLEGLDEVKKMFSSTLLKSVLEKALNETAADVKKAEVEEMKRVFKNPGRWVLNSLYIWRANRTTLEASVGVKDAAVKILAHHIYGGPREQKRSEKWLQMVGGTKYYVPSTAGKVSPSKVLQILSATGAHPDPYSRTTARSRKRNKAMPNYFVVRHVGNLQPGVYQRMAGGRIKPVLIFVENVNYPVRFNFFEVGEKTVAKVWAKNFSAAYQAAFRSNVR